MTKLLTVQNAKTSKGESLGYLTGILYLAPHNEAYNHGVIDRKVNLCPNASEGCAKACLFTAGRGKFNNVLQGRLRKTKLFIEDRELFMSQLIHDVSSLIRKAKRENLIPVVRLNGTSDIPFESLKLNGKSIMDIFPELVWYDYTKSVKRMTKQKLPSNYHLTFSKSETNYDETIQVLESGGNVAVVFNTKKGNGLPESYLGYKVIDGDTHDLRFLDDKNVIIGLRAKGDAKKDTSRFVVHESDATSKVDEQAA